MSRYIGFFQGCRPELAKAHLTQDKGDINSLLVKVSPDLYRYAYAVVESGVASWSDPDDYAQIGLLTIVKYLPRYRYICSSCAAEYDNEKDFTNHSREIHNGTFPPKSTLEQYLNFTIRGQILNFKRSEFAQKRKPLFDMTTMLGIADTLHNPGTDLHTDLVSKLAIEKLKLRLDSEVDKRIKIYIARLVEGASKRDAYQAICESGLCSSIDSARVTINNLKKNTNRFNKYRQALVG